MACRIVDDFIFRGEKAVSMENGTVRSIILPERGAKVASLCLRESGTSEKWTEVLSRIDAERYKIPPAYGREFAGEDGSGFDDMVPTIDTCEIPGPRENSVRLPDHGEVWSLPWKYTVAEDSISFSVDGVKLPYHFEKCLTLRDNELVLDYSAENRSADRIPFQWAAHALFRISPDARLDVPENMDSIYNVYAGARLPEAGRTYKYPFPFGKDNIDLSLMPPKNSRGAQKYWFSAPVSDGTCAIIDYEKGVKSSLIFDREILPWLGIWVNEGGWHNGYNIGLEPSTCWLDSPAAAMKHERCLFLGSRETKKWSLAVRLERISG